MHADAYFGEEIATFGDRVAAAREAAGLTQAQLARRMGIKTSTIESWEEDRAEPRANKLQMMSGLLNVSIIWLMSGQGEGITVTESDDTADISEVLTELRTIRTEQQRLTERLARLEKRLRLQLG
jgi:transcriptional regulator with XRE-family HTH domain